MPDQQKRILLTLSFLLLLPYTQFASAVIGLVRTGCMGECPIYKLAIYDDGTVVYEGYGNVKIKGVRTARVPISQAHELIAMVNGVGFFAFDNEYKEAITDIPTFTTSVRIGVMAKTVVRYGCAPQHLIDLEYRIDEIAGSDRWVGEHSYLRGKRMRCPYYGY